MYPLIFHNFRLKRCLAKWSVVPTSITIFCGAFSTLCGGCAAAGGPPVVGGGVVWLGGGAAWCLIPHWVVLAMHQKSLCLCHSQGQTGSTSIIVVFSMLC